MCSPFLSHDPHTVLTRATPSPANRMNLSSVVFRTTLYTNTASRRPMLRCGTVPTPPFLRASIFFFGYSLLEFRNPGIIFFETILFINRVFAENITKMRFMCLFVTYPHIMSTGQWRSPPLRDHGENVGNNVVLLSAFRSAFPSQTSWEVRSSAQSLRLFRPSPNMTLRTVHAG